MSTRLRDAVVKRLKDLPEDPKLGAVRRISVEVEADGRVETVILSLRDDTLQCFSSDGDNQGAHVALALRFVAGIDAPEELRREPARGEGSGTVDAPTAEELADALEDLLTAIVRVGVREARYAPSVDDALERVIRAAPTPTPAGLGRAMSLLQEELRDENERRVARLLDGVSRFTGALRGGAHEPKSRRRVDAWLGVRDTSSAEVELLSDRTMVEVGREWISGIERASVERRYLIDVRSGRIFREDRPRGAVASVGPCPREIHVGLAEVEPGPEPPRMRVLQYEVRPEVSAEAWERLEQVARRSFAELTESYRQALVRDPALAEPFVLVKPYRIERNGVFKAFDAEGRQLVLDREARRGAVLAVYDLLDDGVEPTWFAGRLTDRGATLCIAPYALRARDGRYLRL